MPEPRTLRGLRLSNDGIAAIQKLADTEDRTWSAMARILLTEAIDARTHTRPGSRRR